MSRAENISYMGVGGGAGGRRRGICFFSLLNIIATPCFGQMSESYPIKARKGSMLASYLDLAITVAPRFCNFWSLSFKVWMRPYHTLQQYIKWDQLKSYSFLQLKMRKWLFGVTRFKAPIPEKSFLKYLWYACTRRGSRQLLVQETICALMETPAWVCTL